MCIVLSFPSEILQVVNFAKQISDFPDTAENFLQTLGDGNWLPGGGVPGSKRGGGNTSGEMGDFALLSKYLGESRAHCVPFIFRAYFRVEDD